MNLAIEHVCSFDILSDSFFTLHCSFTELLAKEFVKIRGRPVHNYKDIVCDYIEEHEKGKASVHNVTGLLFYLTAGRDEWTCGDVLKAIQRVTHCEYISEIKALMR